MLEINGLGTPNVQISKTHVRKHLNIVMVIKVTKLPNRKLQLKSGYSIVNGNRVLYNTASLKNAKAKLPMFAKKYRTITSIVKDIFVGNKIKSK